MAYYSLLLTIIKTLSTQHREFFLNPDTDFTRIRKFSLFDTVTFILCIEAGSVKKIHIMI